MHELFTAIIDPQRFQKFVELTFVGLLIENDGVREHIIKPDILQVLSTRPGLERLKIGIAIDPLNHIAYVTNNDNIMISVIDTIR